MTQQTMLKLQHSESVVVAAAAQIYAAYISSGKVTQGAERDWMQHSVRQAIHLAQLTDQLIQSDDENRQREAF